MPYLVTLLPYEDLEMPESNCKDAVVTLKRSTICHSSCSACGIHQACLPTELESGDIEKLEQIVQHAVPLRRGDYLFRQNDLFRSVYLVHSGILKMTITTDDGKEQITGFRLPGQMVGLNALANDRHGTSARAVEPASVCRIPYPELEALSLDVPGLQRGLRQFMSHEIAEIKNMLILLGKKSAEQRLASFILHLAHYAGLRGYTHKKFNLGISRREIANFLGLSTETVSRLFARLQDLEILSAHCKHVEIHDVGGLRKLAGTPDKCDYQAQRFSGAVPFAGNAQKKPNSYSLTMGRRSIPV